MNYTNNISTGGISQANRRHLSTLHRKTSGPFGVDEVAALLKLSHARTRRFLAYLASRGWLSRVRRGLYVVSPLDASRPGEWREDPWIVAARAFRPCYIGGWSAYEYWGLTEQIFRDIVVITSRQVRDRRPTIQGTQFRIKVLPEEKLFGTRHVWRKEIRVQVSDPSRTLVDTLDDPALGGGMRQIAGIVVSYFASDLHDNRLLTDYIERLGNRTVYKRLGYLVEILSLNVPDILQTCRDRMSSGDTVFDPTVARRGRLIRRWNLWVNTQIRREEHFQ